MTAARIHLGWPRASFIVSFTTKHSASRMSLAKNLWDATIRHRTLPNLSDDARLLVKALDVVDMLYKAFFTPERLPKIHR